MNLSLSVKEANQDDYENMVDYFLKADEALYQGMGVDPLKLPKREEWLKLLSENHKRPVQDKTLFYIIWLADDIPVGHSNINKIIFGEHTCICTCGIAKNDKKEWGLNL
jgi:[ribosomal protein S5]-alanine N-acetyltransferase